MSVSVWDFLWEFHCESFYENFYESFSGKFYETFTVDLCEELYESFSVAPSPCITLKRAFTEGKGLVEILIELSLWDFLWDFHCEKFYETFSVELYESFCVALQSLDYTWEGLHYTERLSRKPLIRVSVWDFLWEFECENFYESLTVEFLWEFL